MTMRKFWHQYASSIGIAILLFLAAWYALVPGAVYANAAKVAASPVATEIFVTDMAGKALPGIGRDIELQIHYRVKNISKPTIKSPQLQTPSFLLDAGKRIELVGKQSKNCKLNRNFICSAANLPANSAMEIVLTYKVDYSMPYGQKFKLDLHFNAHSGINALLTKPVGVVKTDILPPSVAVTLNGQANTAYTNIAQQRARFEAADADKRVVFGRFFFAGSWQTLAALPQAQTCPTWESCNYWDGSPLETSLTFAEGRNAIAAEAQDSDDNIGSQHLVALLDLVAPKFTLTPNINSGQAVSGDKFTLEFTATDPLRTSNGLALAPEDVSGLARWRWREAGEEWSSWLDLPGAINRSLELKKSYASEENIVITVEIQDRAGNGSTATAKATYALGGVGDAGTDWIRPYAGSAAITSPFGPRWGGFHDGTDYGLACGTPLYAVRAGRVIAANTNGIVLGNASSPSTPANYIIIDHGGGWQSYYWHLNKVFVQAGQQVSQGAFIGRSGNTGYVRGDGSLPVSAQGCHLHFELHYQGVSVDPEKVLPGN
jgi:murein DD-endopeptidase MepM/ murein hydrolase activator NlpD